MTARDDDARPPDDAPGEASGERADTAITRAPAPVVEPPSADVQLADEATPLPGIHRGGFSRLPTAPIAVTTQSAPAEPGTADEPEVRWILPALQPYRGIAGWALGFSITGLVVSLFVGWGFPLGIVGIVTSLVALRRPVESRVVAIWALVLGLVSILYSAGWLFWAATTASLFG